MLMREALRGGTCWDPSKDPLKAALSPAPTQELPNQVKLLSSLHTLKVWLLVGQMDSLGVKEDFSIVYVLHVDIFLCDFVCVFYFIFKINLKESILKRILFSSK